MKIAENQFNAQGMNYESQPQKVSAQQHKQPIEKSKEFIKIPGDTIIDDEMIDKSIERANKSLKPMHKVVERRVHEKTGAIMYTIKNTDTGEVIREFPPKKIEDMLAKMWELAGLFVDERI